MKLLFILLLLIFTFTNCSKNPQTTKNYPTNNSGKELKRIHFDFNSATVRSDMSKVMSSNIEFLQKNPDIKLVIEGHTDERGTNEYNLALGDRRADNAKKFLMNKGIDQNRLRTISYGEERPIDYDSNEKAWYINRRVEFIRY
jgi:peptidoglycan-associated lipoprotein